MDDVAASAGCEMKCLPNCETVVYNYMDKEFDLDTEELCKIGSDTRKVDHKEIL